MLKPGDVIGNRYEVESMLAQGGMGHIYLVRDAKLNHKVWVMKEIVRMESRERFIEEAHMLTRLSHPHIPKITDYFEPDAEGKCYLVMEYIQGITLQERMDRAPGGISLAASIRYMLELCEILDYLHRQPKPVVFRDLKPSNIMIDEQDHVRLIDFGIARNYDGDKLSDTVQIGTVAFAAPEQFDRKQTDPRTDIYAVGAVLYYLVTGGKYVFRSTVPPQAEISRLPAELADLLERLLQPNPDDRFQDIAEVNERLKSIQRKLEQAEGKPKQTEAGTERAEVDTRRTEPADRTAVIRPMPAERPPNDRTGRIFDPVSRPSVAAEPYSAQATQGNPALVIYLLDASGSMGLNDGGKSRLEVVTDSLYVALKQMVFRSTKGSRISPRYRVAIIAYSDEVHDLLGEIKSIDALMQTGTLPVLKTYRFTDTAKAFLYAEDMLKRELPHIQDCPAPLICHMTDGVYTGEDPEPIVRRIRSMAVKDGNVLVENIFVSNDLLGHGVDQPKRWQGVQDDTVFRDEYGYKLKKMSSIIPDSYRQMMIEANYSLSRNAYMMFPGSNPDLVSLGFQMSAATPVHGR